MLSKILAYLMAGAAAMLLPACNGIFGDIYDTVDDKVVPDYGFISEPSATSPGTIYINATDYTRWTYIDFSSMTIDTLSVDEPEPERWDLAIHRYDAKTNGGEVRVEGSDVWVKDVWTTDVIVTDMSHMMDGWLSYAESYYNPLLSEWLDVDKSTMPPVYTLSGKTYILRTAEGQEIALKLVNYMNPGGVKGYMTIDYIINE